MWKSFNDKAVAPRFIKKKKQPLKGHEKVNITMFRSGWCQSMNVTCERMKRASLEFPGKINLQEHDTIDENVAEEWGMSDALFIDGREIGLGPPVSYEKLRKKIQKSASRISD